MLEFAPNTYMLEYQNSAYLCNGTKRIEAPLNLDTLEEAVRQCPKLQQVLLDNPELQAPIHALREFFNDMNRWEQMAEQKGRGDQAEIDALFARRVSWSPVPAGTL